MSNYGLSIIFENSDFLIIDKPAGIVVNRSQTIKEKTLQDQLSEYFGLDALDLGIGDRAGIVHRLDRETSGLMIVAKAKNVFDFLQNEFKNRKVEKTYTALVHGFTQGSGSVDLAIDRIGKFGKFGVVKRGGREAKTEYKKISDFQFPTEKIQNLTKDESKNRVRYLTSNATKYSLVEFYPKTGRTHQIRVHSKSMGNPIVSDLIYAPSKLLKFDLMWCPRLFLHSTRISFQDPKKKKMLEFKSALPEDLKVTLNYLSPISQK